MRYLPGSLIIAALALATAACSSDRYTTAGFHLPGNGNPEHGKAAFVELGCSSCHKVYGADLPNPTVTPVVPVNLGGLTSRRLSDAYIVTAMLNPDYHLAPHIPGEITENGHSRMPTFADKITVRQMLDITAYLQSTYVVQRPLPNAPFQ